MQIEVGSGGGRRQFPSLSSSSPSSAAAAAVAASGPGLGTAGFERLGTDRSVAGLTGGGGVGVG